MLSNQYSFLGMHLIWWVVWMGVLIWIFATPWDIPGQRRRRDSPLQLAKRRLASGTISKEEYSELLKILKRKP
ncbi:MAG: SHOCT domain-containing protein [Flavobacterium sp.]|nr:MAG: SHOCT domain-containing protein [Flavobacterium sp.]